MQYPTEPNNCDLASLQKSSQNVPQIGPKILPKMLPNRSKMDPKINPKWSLGASGANMTPKNDFSSILGTSFGAGNAPQIDPKIKHFQVSPRNSFYAMGAPKTLQNHLQNGFQNQPFSQEVQNLKILLSPRRGPSFRGLDPFKITSFFEPFLQPLSNPS